MRLVITTYLLWETSVYLEVVPVPPSTLKIKKVRNSVEKVASYLKMTLTALNNQAAGV